MLLEWKELLNNDSRAVFRYESLEKSRERVFKCPFAPPKSVRVMLYSSSSLSLPKTEPLIDFVASIIFSAVA